jgi:RimJ/RimL family protein N-acetyltransferase
VSDAVRSARLVLQPVGCDVARAVLSGAGPDAARGWPGEDALQAFRFAVDHGADPGWLILRDGLVVGECGTHGPPDPEGAVEIRYGIAPSERGQGLATEACAALSGWLLIRPGVSRVEASTHAAGNPASRRVLERCGFSLDRVEGPMARYVLMGPQKSGAS